MSAGTSPPEIDPPEELENEPEATAVRAVGPYIGRYRLCFEIAAGGMAMVYLARAEGPESFEKVVALKCIHRHLAREREFVEMFLDEAKIVSRIHHANVCTLFDFGEADGAYFIAMEYLVGEPLSRVLKAVAKKRIFRDSPRLPFYIARVIADVCEGLHAAHELVGPSGAPLEVVHRDVSPQNLFLTYDGIAKVMDFGIASAQERVHQTATGQLKGKFAYMAPEQLWRLGADRRADVWSLGVVLWEMLTFERLFRRPTEIDTMHAVTDAPIVAPSTHNPRVPKELDAIVLRALSRDRNARYPTARELGRDLTRFAGTGPPLGLAELSDWMHALFPDAEGRKKQLVAAARAAPATIAIARAEPPEAASETRLLGLNDEANTQRARRPRRTILWVMLIAIAPVGVLGYLVGLFFVGEPAANPSDVGLDRRDETVVAPARTDEVPAAIARSDAGLDAGAPRDAGRDAGAESRETQAVDRVATGPGTLAVVTPGGWANVYDGHGRLLGETPLRVELRAGRHTIELRPNGQPPSFRRSVTVRAGETARVVVPIR
jgi:tRNA A-37 threonylcarbamoyl transferase component Bud32